MTVRIVGAGLPRTGTTSLKLALERLLGAPCYHMRSLINDLNDALTWRDAFQGEPPEWDAFLSGYAAGVDWPFSCFWRELAAHYPDAPVLLSRRTDAATWYTSMDQTILGRVRMLKAGGARHAEQPDRVPWLAHATPEQIAAMDGMWDGMVAGVVDDPDDAEAVMAAYDRHLAAVRAAIPADRLLEWAPGDGWEPLCAALGVPVPDEPFPHENSTAEMRAKIREFGLVD